MSTESRNCLREAEGVCRSLNVPQSLGPYVVNVRAPYYCQATDALAGTYVVKSRAFATASAALAYAATIEAGDPELSCELVTDQKQEPTTPEEEIPF